MATTGKGFYRAGVLLGLSAAAVTLGAACSAPSGESLGTNRAAGSTAFTNDQTAYDYFRAKGFTTFQAAGIVGNLDQESGLDPTISQQGGGPGRGIAQWSAGGRWDTDPGDNLVAFAAMEGESPDTLGVQLDFIMFELQSSSDYGLAQLQATTNVTDATTDFELEFEGCDVASECDLDSRISYAQSVLAAYQDDPVEGDAGSGAADAAGHAASDATAPPSTSGDAGPGPGTSEDAGVATAATSATSQGGGGCAVSAPGPRSRAPAMGWVATLGLIAGLARRRVRRGQGLPAA